MKATWIANAVINKKDHLQLTHQELAHWQRHGARFSFGAPWYSHGSFACYHVMKMGHELEQFLIQTPPEIWPEGLYKGRMQGPGIVLPKREFERVAEDRWKVPLIPSDINHCLDGWSFDISLSDAEFDALKPIAKDLARRMLIRCEVKSASATVNRTVLWEEGRVRLCGFAGIEPVSLLYYFDHTFPYDSSAPVNMAIADSLEYQQSFNQEVEERSRVDYDRELSASAVGYGDGSEVRLPNVRRLSKDGEFIREVVVEPSGCIKNLFQLTFSSRYLAAKHPNARRTNFSLSLDRVALEALRTEIDSALGNFNYQGASE